LQRWRNGFATHPSGRHPLFFWVFFCAQDGLELSFSLLELLLSAGAALFSAWYLKERHWFANNVLGLAFSLQGIEHLSLGSVAIGIILLGG
jgi:minor histocompatibility antigen H13